MIQPEYHLIIPSTGKVLKTEQTEDSALAWYTRWTRRLLRYQRTPEHVKNAIRAGDILVGWSNFDACRCDGMTEDEACAVLAKFTSYHRRYWPD